jgi:Ca-activated chloride channel family protein
MEDNCTIEFIPMREAAPQDEKSSLHALIRIRTPEPDFSGDRSPLNLALVIDRSGSMAGDKLAYAKKAAQFVVDEATPKDTLSVVSYDDEVVIEVPGGRVSDKKAIKRRIRAIRSGGRTALHDGWVQGGICVGELMADEALNRVILLSDGLANVGERNREKIAEHVRGLAERGISTTALGVGLDYDEEMLSGMANGGGGYFWHISHPKQLPSIFNQELQGLHSIFGKNAVLKINPGQGVKIARLHKTWDQMDKTSWRIPFVSAGAEMDVLVQLDLKKGANLGRVCEVLFSWEDPRSTERGAQDAAFSLDSVPAATISEYAVNPEVEEAILLEEAAESKKEALEAARVGNVTRTREVLETMKRKLTKLGRSSTSSQAEVVEALEAMIARGNMSAYEKLSEHQLYNHGKGHYQAILGSRFAGGPFLGDLLDPPDVFGQRADAIVSPNGTQLMNTGVVSHQILQAAGPRFPSVCAQAAPVAIGEAVATSGCDLFADWVIHAVAPSYLPNTRVLVDLMRKCFAAIIREARAKRVQVLAMPALGTGLLGWPVEEAANLLFSTMYAYLSHSGYPSVIQIVCHDKSAKAVYDDAFERITGMRSAN